MTELNRAYTELTIKSIDEDRRIIRGMATTPQVDRVGDIVDPMGARFEAVVPLLWQHKHDLPVGQVRFGKPTPQGIPFEAEIAKVDEPGKVKERLDEAWHSVKSKLVRFVSVGIRAVKNSLQPLSTGGVKFTSYELTELSLVTIPANPGATITEIKAFDKGLLSAATGTEEQEPSLKALLPARDEGKKTTVVTLAKAKGKTMSKLQASLKGYEDTLAAKRAERTETINKSLDEGRTVDSAEKEAIDTLSQEIKALEDQVTMVKGLIDADVATAKTVDGTTERKTATRVDGIKVQANHAEKGMAMAQLVRLHYQAGGNQFALAQIAESQKGSIDPRVVDFAKAAVPAANTGVPAWAGNLVTPGGVYGDFVEYLMPFTIIGKFGRDGRPALRSVPFNVPLIGQLTAGSAAWTGEGRAKPLTQWTYGTSMLQPLKIATIAVVTEELLKRASLPADMMIRDELVRALIARMDTDFVNPTKAAVAGISPASVTNGVTPIVSSGNDAVAIRNDIAALMGKFLAANNVPSTGVYLMGTALALQLSMMQNPLGQTEFPGIGMTGGTFMGLPVIVSDYVPAETVILMNANDVYFADEGGIDVSMSREASLEMDSAPAHNSTTPTPAQLVSLWQTNSVAWRVERSLNWAKRRPEAVQVLGTVKWGQPTTP